MSATTTASSLRRTKSLNTIQENPIDIHSGSNSDKAPYFEGLVTSKATSKLLTHFVKKVSLQPLAQLVKRPKPSSSQRLSPPPFTTHKSLE
jgi:hypothetical protein